MIDFHPIAVGTGAPCACVRCGAVPEASYASVAAIEALLAGVPAMADGARGETTAGPAYGVALTGPEPFAHPELPALVAACRRAGFSRIAVETDGAALAAHIAAHRRLTHPDEMGQLFKVLAAYPEGKAPPPGLDPAG